MEHEPNAGHCSRWGDTMVNRRIRSLSSLSYSLGLAVRLPSGSSDVPAAAVGLRSALGAGWLVTDQLSYCRSVPEFP